MGSALACHSDPAEGHSFRGSAGGDTAACGLDGSFSLSPLARLCGQGFPSGMCVPGTGPRGRRYQLTVLLAAEPTVWPVHSEGIFHLSKRLNGWKPGNSSLLEEDGPAEEEQSGVRRGEAEDASLP